MVYTGKPSRACQNCKSRRIKCDETRPHCANCTKKSLQCPGYPDEFDLLFRDETANMAKKAKRTSPPRGQVRSMTARASSSKSVEQRQVERRSRSTSTESEKDEMEIEPKEESNLMKRAGSSAEKPSLPSNLSQSDESEAISFFFRNFVMLPRETESIRGYLEHLVPLYNQASPSSVLHAATQAVALCTLGAYPNRSHMLQKARRKYGDTLQRVKIALSDPVQAKSDETLLAIMMCALYEEGMLTIDEMKSDPAPKRPAPQTTEPSFPWVRHVEGAVALVKYRGEEQFHNKQSYDMFRAVRAMMLMSCMQRQTPIEEFPSPLGWKGYQDSEENAANRLTILSLNIPKLQSEVNKLVEVPRNPQTEKEAYRLIESAKVTESNLVSWLETLPKDWAARTTHVVTSMPGDIHEAPEWLGPQHAYKDVFVASLINENRVHRILVQGLIHTSHTWLHQGSNDVDAIPEIQSAAAVTRQMANEICASVPYHTQIETRLPQGSTEEEQTAALAIGAYMLTWPLLVCVKNQIIPEQQRQWIQGHLVKLGRVFGLNPAQLRQVTNERFIVSSVGFP